MVAPQLYYRLTVTVLLLFACHQRAAAQTTLYLDQPGETAEAPDVRLRDDHNGRMYRVGRPYLTVFKPPEGVPLRGAAVICPGGGYGYLSMDKEGEEVARWLSRNGFVGMALGYRLPHEGQIETGIPLPQRDGLAGLRRARHLMDSLGIAPDKLLVVGFSAGGHLASSLVQLAEDTLQPNASILVYPVISMRDGIGHRGSREKLLGQTPTEEILARYSTDERIAAGYPPTLLVHATDDRTVPVENSLRYYEGLRAHGVPAALYVTERGGHGFGIRRNLGWTEAALAWLERQGF
jgi:acetyl esterase/lipase